MTKTPARRELRMTSAENPEDSTGGSPDGAAGDTDVELRAEDWPDSPELGCGESSPQEMEAYWATVRRIQRMTLVAGAAFAAAAAWLQGWVLAAGLLAGAVVACINFRWLAASVNALGESIAMVKNKGQGAAAVARGVGRIFLIALFACVIVRYSMRGLVGFLAGLVMPVVAMMCEAAYEFVVGNRRLS